MTPEELQALKDEQLTKIAGEDQRLASLQGSHAGPAALNPSNIMSRPASGQVPPPVPPSGTQVPQDGQPGGETPSQSPVTSGVPQEGQGTDPGYLVAVRSSGPSKQAVADVKGVQTAQENELAANVANTQRAADRAVQAQNEHDAAERARLIEERRNDAQAQLEDQAYERDIQKRVADSDAMTDRLGNLRVDPDRYFRNKDTGSKILAVLGSALLGSAGNPQVGINAIQHAIDRDVAAQEMDANSLSRSAQLKRGMISDLREFHGDKIRARLEAKDAAYKRTEREYAELKARNQVLAGSDQAKAMDLGLATLRANNRKELDDHIRASTKRSIIGIDKRTGRPLTEKEMEARDAEQRKTESTIAINKAKQAGTAGKAPIGAQRLYATNKYAEGELGKVLKDLEKQPEHNIMARGAADLGLTPGGADVSMDQNNYEALGMRWAAISAKQSKGGAPDAQEIEAANKRWPKYSSQGYRERAAALIKQDMGIGKAAAADFEKRYPGIEAHGGQEDSIEDQLAERFREEQ